MSPLRTKANVTQVAAVENGSLSVQDLEKLGISPIPLNPPVLEIGTLDNTRGARVARRSFCVVDARKC